MPVEWPSRALSVRYVLEYLQCHTTGTSLHEGLIGSSALQDGYSPQPHACSVRSPHERLPSTIGGNDRSKLCLYEPHTRYGLQRQISGDSRRPDFQGLSCHLMSAPAHSEELPGSPAEKEGQRTEENLTTKSVRRHCDCYEACCGDPRQGYLDGPRCVRRS